MSDPTLERADAADPLDGLRVVDMSTALAGPNCARYLADFGADVIKVERPDGDSLSDMAWRDPRDGSGLWWKLVNRNKRTIVLDVKDWSDRAVLLEVIDGAHARNSEMFGQYGVLDVADVSGDAHSEFHRRRVGVGVARVPVQSRFRGTGRRCAR